MKKSATEKLEGEILELVQSQRHPRDLDQPVAIPDTRPDVISHVARVKEAMEEYLSFQQTHLAIVDEKNKLAARLDAELITSENLRKELAETRAEMNRFMRISQKAYTIIGDIGLISDQAREMVRSINAEEESKKDGE